MKYICFPSTIEGIKKAETYYTIILYIVEALFLGFGLIKFKQIIEFDLATIVFFSSLLIVVIILHIPPILAGIQIDIKKLNTTNRNKTN